MTATAIVIMIISILVLWGGLVLSVVHLMRADARLAAAGGHPHHHTLSEARDHTL